MQVAEKSLAEKVSEFITKCLGEHQPTNATTRVAVPILKSVDELKREVVFIVAEPNVLDKHGNWYSPETLRKACSNFKENLEKGNVATNLFHVKDDDGNVISTETYSHIDSWNSPTDCIIGGESIAEGTWLTKCKFNSEALWSMFLDGTVSGISYGAKGIIGGRDD